MVKYRVWSPEVLDRSFHLVAKIGRMGIYGPMMEHPNQVSNSK